MSNYVEVHATSIPDNSDFPTKAALKRALAADPAKVHIASVSPFNAPIRTSVDKAPEAFIYQVTGPNPYTKRNWYANVTVRADGKITVK